jgi:osmotically-inducible protein OsmY
MFQRENDREYGFRQSHGGRGHFEGGEWGKSSEFGRNSGYREADSPEHSRPFDMDNYYSGRQFSVGGVDFQRDIDTDFDEHEYNRSRFAEPYTGGQFARSQYGRGSSYSRDWTDRSRSPLENFSGKGPKGYKKSDERIQEEVCEALYHDPLVDASDIEVTVTDGCVYLRGTVDSRRTKREAESCVEHLNGVEDVQNELRVQGPLDSNNVPSSDRESSERSLGH